jgi:hypothetical protein
LILVDFSHFAASAPLCVQPLNPPKHKITIEIPPYYIDTLAKSIPKKSMNRKVGAVFEEKLRELLAEQLTWMLM